MAGLQGAVESTGPVSRLHSRGSDDPADFGVPTGREEEWRVTPLRRLRGLHSDSGAGDGKVGVEVNAAPRVAVVLGQHGDPRLGTAFVPSDRVSARAFASYREATVVTVPAGEEIALTTWITVHGDDIVGAAFGHLLIDVKPNASAVVVLEHTG